MSAELRVGMVRVEDIRFHPHNTRTNLGDLRTLTASIERHGIMQPVVVERYGDQLRLRAGHRRVAAARLAGLARVPAVIHPEALDEDEWLVQSIAENVERRGLVRQDRRRAVLALRRHGCSWQGIADAFGVAVTTVASWTRDEAADPQEAERRARKTAERAATRRIVEKHGDEWRRMVAEELLRQRPAVQEAS